MVLVIFLNLLLPVAFELLLLYLELLLLEGKSVRCLLNLHVVPLHLGILHRLPQVLFILHLLRQHLLHFLLLPSLSLHQGFDVVFAFLGSVMSVDVASQHFFVLLARPHVVFDLYF